MDNNNQTLPTDGQEKKSGGTLDLQNIQIKTLKDDLAVEEGPEKDKSGWFSFLAKHKAETPTPETAKAPGGKTEDSEQSPELSAVTTTEKTETELPESSSDNLLEKELDQFKAETQEGGPIEAPSNLPISENDSLAHSLGDSQTVPSETNSVETLTSEANLAAAAKSDERPALGSFFPPKPAELEGEKKEESVFQNKLSTALSGTPADSIKTEIPLKNEPEKKIVLKPEGQVEMIKSIPKEGISGGIVEEKEENKKPNPFSAQLDKNEAEKNSLLQSVESALNYSAPPEFNEQREKNETGEAETGEPGQVVDLRKKGPAHPGVFSNKRMLMVFGGLGGIVVLIVVTLAIVLGRSSAPSKSTNVNTNSVAQTNKNQNTNPISPVTPTVTPPKPTLTPQKVLTNSMDIKVSSLDAVSQEFDNLRQSGGVQKQTQLVFTKSDGSAVSYQDLINATGINIPQRIIPSPAAVPALVFADFFKGKTIFGLIIPTSDSEDQAVSKMKNWESTMVIDLSDLWKGINIDNQGAYFADSKLFDNARFALIDKKSKLSLDYSIFNGYIFVACGKDSMAIVQKQFTAPSSAGAGIKWEGDSTTNTQGVDTKGTTLNNDPNNTGSSNTSDTGDSGTGGNLNTPPSQLQNSGSSN